ncbi:50S ribosomal protein L13 [Candidatus Micrarchaeota archaeon]|nr:50S ribosomal protein L13 [Candidatus Micrarchaeota archaeon]
MPTFDATNIKFGRAASQIAKKLISGEEINIVNAEKFVIVGNPKQIIERYITKRGLKHKGCPEKSPKWSKVPHILVKRMVRGMLPIKSSRGRDALKRLKVYTGNPKNAAVDLRLEKAEFDGVSKHITIHELCRMMGYSG